MVWEAYMIVSKDGQYWQSIDGSPEDLRPLLNEGQKIIPVTITKGHKRQK